MTNGGFGRFAIRIVLALDASRRVGLGIFETEAASGTSGRANRSILSIGAANFDDVDVATFPASGTGRNKVTSETRVVADFAATSLLACPNVGQASLDGVVFAAFFAVDTGDALAGFTDCIFA